jgi:hypothetical protein
MIRSSGAMKLSSFVVWQEGLEGRKELFVLNLSSNPSSGPKEALEWRHCSSALQSCNAGRQ